ncbi:MAG: hypothetical protein QM811_01960 [Pirellulales bacterium]
MVKWIALVGTLLIVILAGAWTAYVALSYPPYRDFNQYYDGHQMEREVRYDWLTNRVNHGVHIDRWFVSDPNRVHIEENDVPLWGVWVYYYRDNVLVGETKVIEARTPDGKRVCPTCEWEMRYVPPFTAMTPDEQKRFDDEVENEREKIRAQGNVPTDITERADPSGKRTRATVVSATHCFT